VADDGHFKPNAICEVTLQASVQRLIYACASANGMLTLIFAVLVISINFDYNENCGNCQVEKSDIHLHPSCYATMDGVPCRKHDGNESQHGWTKT
jgi:tetrahydromethanopterin S-methyltransferase subunit C